MDAGGWAARTAGGSRGDASGGFGKEVAREIGDVVAGEVDKAQAGEEEGAQLVVWAGAGGAGGAETAQAHVEAEPPGTPRGVTLVAARAWVNMRARAREVARRSVSRPQLTDAA